MEGPGGVDLPRLTVSPVFLSLLVIHHADDVEVALLVGGVVARFAHEVGNELEEFGCLDPAAAMVHRSDSGRIHAGYDAGS